MGRGPWSLGPSLRTRGTPNANAAQALPHTQWATHVNTINISSNNGSKRRKPGALSLLLGMAGASSAQVDEERALLVGSPEPPATPTTAAAAPAAATAPRLRGGVYSVGFALVVCVVFSLSALLLVDHRAPATVGPSPQPQQQKLQLLGKGEAASGPVLWRPNGTASGSQSDAAVGAAAAGGSRSTARSPQHQQRHQAGEDAPSLEQLMQLVATQHPIHRKQCGRWVHDYTQLHRAVLAGEAPQRYAVMRSRQEFGNGLADRLATSVTIFLYALLSNRAFQYDWDPGPLPEQDRMVLQRQCGKLAFYEPSTHLWSALRSDFIDWRYSGPDVGNKSIVMDYNCDMQTEVYKSFFTDTDIARLHDDYHTVVWHADHAMVYAAFDNPRLAPRLAELGLQRETAFACMFDFLYRPTPEVLELFRPELGVLLDPAVLKVGVQIRVGDWQLCDSYMFKPQNYPSLFDHYFECAREIEEELAAPGQRVVYYTLSDIPQLRQGLAERWASRILVNTRVSVEHIVKSRNSSQQGFFQAAGELWAFSLTTAHVITRKSGFGKVPAMVNANGTQHIFTVDYPMKFGWFGLDNRKNIGWIRRLRCSAKHATPLSQVCTDFTGI